MSLSIEEVIKSMKRLELPQDVIQKMVADLRAKEAEIKDEKAANQGTKSKNQFVIVSVPNTSYGWVAQLPEEAAPQAVLEGIYAAAHAFNKSKKGSKHPVNTVGETCESVPRKFWKESGIGILLKTKIGVPIIETDNSLSPAPSV